jgi:dipeptidyl aminopeptidase/acylaminoacyl peptidase
VEESWLVTVFNTRERQIRRELDKVNNDMKRLGRILAVLILGGNCVLGQAIKNDEIVPGDNLIADGIPKIPASLAQTVNRYTNFRYASLLSWHPIKREMLISTQFGDTPQIHQVKFPGGARTQLTFFSDPVFIAAYEPKRGDYFVFSKDSNGDEFYQLNRFDVATGDVTALTDGKARNESPLWSHSGEWLVYGSTRRNGKDMDLYIINPLDRKSDRMLAQLPGGFWVPYDWSPDDRRVLVYEYISANENNLWIFDVTTGRKTLVTPKRANEQTAYWFGQFSKDGKGVYVTTDRDSEYQQIGYIDLTSGQYKPLTENIKADVDEFDLSPNGRTLAFVTNEDGIGRLHLLDVGTCKEKPTPQLPVGIVAGVKWHPNGRELGFVFTSPRYPTDVYSYDTQTGKLDRWTFSETGGINAESFSEAELIRWKSFDGRMISGFIYRPPARFKGKRPVIIGLHGGPQTQTRPSFGGRIHYYINELGTAIIYPNVRGSSGYGKTFLKLDNGFQREDAHKDVGALLDWIKTQPSLDADRVMVFGESYGGYLALAVAANYSNRIRAASSTAGPSNLVTYLQNSDEWVRELQRVEFGDERDPKIREFLNRIAPLNNVQKIKAPLFIVQGKNDTLVPPTESEQLVNAVRKNGTPVWYLAAKDEGHGFIRKTNRDFQFYSAVLFVKEYLLK